MRSAGAVIDLILYLYLLLLLGRLVVEWLQYFARDWVPRGFVLVLLEGVFSATDPPIKAVRRMLPPLRLGPVLLDVGFLVVLLAVILLRVLNQSLLYT
ncbi:MAG: YggT family protein [Marmoricola sp.]